MLMQVSKKLTEPHKFPPYDLVNNRPINY